MSYLRDLGSVSAGHSVRGSIDALPSGNVCLVQTRDIDADAGIDWWSAARICPPGKTDPDYLEIGDVLFTARGARNLAVMIAELPGQAICAPNLFVIRVGHSSGCLPEYLAWYINQRPGQTYFQREAMGTNILNIRREVVEDFRVPVPPLARQRALIELDRGARLERQMLRHLIKNRDQQMEALALALAGREEA